MIQDEKLILKQKFLEYMSHLPVIKLAAGSIGRTDDTINNWRKEDPEFSEQIDKVKAEWAQKTSRQVRSKEWLLERVLKDHFSQRTEVTGKDGEKLENLVVVKTDDKTNLQP